MRHIAADSFAKPKSAIYNKFKGVDFAADPASISRDRSPYAPNMISDSGSTPEKRLGWRELVTFPPEVVGEQGYLMPVNGLFACNIEGVTHYIAHVGTKIYRVIFGGRVYAFRIKCEKRKKHIGLRKRQTVYLYGSGIPCV